MTVTDRRTIPDFAARMRHLCDVLYPDADVIRVVLDNLNTHAYGSLFATLAPGEARRLRRKLEFHHTPKHASWLNMAECELSVLAGQCLSRRIVRRRGLVHRQDRAAVARPARAVRQLELAVASLRPLGRAASGPHFSRCCKTPTSSTC